MMAPQKKASSQIIVTSIVAKGKKVINGGTGPADLHPSNLDVIFEQVNEKLSSLVTTLEQKTNEHESQLSIEGQLF